MNRSLLAAALIALVIGFGAGFIVAKGVPGRAGAHADATSDVWSLFGKPRAVGAPRRGEPMPAGFAVWKTRLDTSGQQALGCVRLTRPLDPAKSYADFVLISPQADHPPAVTARGDELCIGGVDFADRKVTLLHGLPDKAGDTLDQDTDVDFTLGDKPPYVGFAGDGVILPRDESDGVGVETVNVAQLYVEVWRVPDRNLVRRSISAPAPTPEGDYADDWEAKPDDEGQIVWKGKVAVKGPLAARTTTVFPLGAVLKAMAPGGYVIKARDASAGRDPTDEEARPARAMRWVIFTDMALTTYKGATALDVVVRSLKTAKVLAGVPLTLVAKDGETLASLRTDATGRAAFPAALLAGQNGAQAKMVMAYGPQGDLAVLPLERSPLDLSRQAAAQPGAESPVAGRTAPTAVDGYLYTDRGIYRPGERAHLIALTRDAESKAVGDRKGFIVVKRPSGVEFKRFVFGATAGGALTADLDLPANAPRGRWTAELHIDGFDPPAGEASFALEDFAPQRLAVAVSDRPDAPVSAGEIRAIDVMARFLYGAAGSGLQTQGEARLRADPDPFPAFKGYAFGDQKQPFDEKFIDLGSSVTDGAGHARLAFAAAQAGDTAEPLAASVTASVFEPGGRPVRQETTLKVRTRPLYLGVAVSQGEAIGDRAPAVSLDVIAVDPLGRRVAAPATWSLIREDWRYDWLRQDGRWQWRGTSRDVAVDKGTLAIAAGQASRLARRLAWGDYRLVVEGAGGVRTVRRFSAGWGAPASDAEAPDQVRLNAPGPGHVQGDTVKVAIKAPYGGEVQVAVATDHVIEMQTLSLPTGQGVVSLKSSAAWGGGAYVMVTVIQPRNPVATPVPRRALGLLYLPIDARNRRLGVEIGGPERIDSQAPVVVPITVHGAGAGRAYVTVAAVDEGILALTRFDSPDPVKWYFGKRALTVEYRDEYGRLLDPNLGAPANVNFGGDELGGAALTTTPIKTVALWSGIVRTDGAGRARIVLPAGHFNGQLRIMAVAWTDTAVGSASKALVVREPVVADLSLPRFLSPGDRPAATLEIDNIDGRPGAYLASTFGAGGISAPFSQTFRLGVGQRIAPRIPFLAPAVTGVGELGFRVTGPGFVTTKRYPIQTRLGWGPITRVAGAWQAPGEVFTPSPALLAGLAAGDVRLQVSYSPFQGFDPAAVALALERYPFGCTEQLASTGYARLYAATVPGAPSPRAGLGASLGALLDRQSLDGSFGLWSVGDGEADAWLGAYATDFLFEARALGAPVPAESAEKAIAAMRQISRPDGEAQIGYRLSYPEGWTPDKSETAAETKHMRSRASAYALYVLAEAGRGDLPRLRWWHDVQMKNEVSPLAMAQVGAGLDFMGDHARARTAFRQAVQALGYKDALDWYQTPLRDLAGVIALAYEAGETDIARGLQGRLTGAMRDPDTLNTQEQAALLRAAHFMLKAAGAPRIEAAGATALPTVGGAPRWAVGRLAAARFVNRGAAPVWRTVTVRGTPLSAPPPAADGLTVAKTLFTLAGAPADLAHLRQGERLIVRIAGVSRQGRTVALAVNDPLPAGLEIEAPLGPADGLGEGKDAKSGAFKFLGVVSAPSARESRDDRYVAALSLPGGKPFAFAYIVRAVTPGAFFLPAAEALDMYHPGVAARSSPGRLTVIPAG